MQSIKPYQQPGRQVYFATWRDAATGKRISRSLGTRDKNEAEAMTSQMMLLDQASAGPDSGMGMMVYDEVYELWYGKKRQIQAGLSREADRARIDELERELDKLKKELEIERGYRERYQALSKSIEGARLLASRSSPTLAGVREDYLLNVEPLSRKGMIHKTWFKRFSASLGEDKKLSDIKPAEIAAYIAADAAAHKKDLIRSKKARAVISRFFSWAAVNHGIINPMDQVAAPRLQAKRDIQWHSLEEIEAVLGGMDVYWRALIGTLAYAGLSAHEVRGLERKDLIENKGRRFLRVTPSTERGLKTHKRQRNVAISARLGPLLDAHLAEIGDESPYLFPSQVKTTLGKMWSADMLSHYFGLRLPEGMDALSLRRTFGSLLIRSGKSAEEVAAAMGNSAEMVTAHYGRILGGEVEIDF